GLALGELLVLHVAGSEEDVGSIFRSHRYADDRALAPNWDDLTVVDPLAFDRQQDRLARSHRIDEHASGLAGRIPALVGQYGEIGVLRLQVPAGIARDPEISAPNDLPFPCIVGDGPD